MFILDNQEVEKQYLLFALAPEQYHDKIIDFANMWICGVEHVFEHLIQTPNPEYICSPDDPYLLRFSMSEYQDHARHMETWDMRNFVQMRDLRNFLLLHVAE
jgi:hypothetical protein